MGSATLRLYASKSAQGAAMLLAGVTFTLVFPERTLDLGADSSAQVTANFFFFFKPLCNVLFFFPSTIFLLLVFHRLRLRMFLFVYLHFDFFTSPLILFLFYAYSIFVDSCLGSIASARFPPARLSGAIRATLLMQDMSTLILEIAAAAFLPLPLPHGSSSA